MINAAPAATRNNREQVVEMQELQGKTHELRGRIQHFLEHL